MNETLSETLKVKMIFRQLFQKMGVQLNMARVVDKGKDLLIVRRYSSSRHSWAVLVKRTSQKKISESWNRNETSLWSNWYFGKGSLWSKQSDCLDHTRGNDHLRTPVVNQVRFLLKTDDHLVMVRIDDIILAEIDKNVLTIYTVNNTYMMRETDKLSASHQSLSFYRYHVMLLWI